MVCDFAHLPSYDFIEISKIFYYYDNLNNNALSTHTRYCNYSEKYIYITLLRMF